MAVPSKSIIDTRHDQMFPNLEASEVERVRRFGEVQSFGAGEALARVGNVGHGPPQPNLGQNGNPKPPRTAWRGGNSAIGKPDD